MFFRNMLFLSILFISAYATSIHPLFAVRQTGSQCIINQCLTIIDQVESGQCNIECICSDTMVNAIQNCLQPECAQILGEPFTGVGPNYIQSLQNLCIAAGHPISGLGGSTGSLTGSSSSASNGLSGTGTGSVASTTNSGSTTLSGTGTALGGSATATTTTGTGNGGKSSATGLTAQLGTIVVAVVLILAA